MTDDIKDYLTRTVSRSIELYEKLVETGRGDATISGTIERFKSIRSQLAAGAPLTKSQRKTLRTNLRTRIATLTLTIIPEYDTRIAKQPTDAARYVEYRKRAQELAELLRRAVGELA